MKRTVVPALAFSALLASSLAAFAQQPTAAQKMKIKLDCGSDFSRLCSGVPTGGMDALKCLEAHTADLSASCQADMQKIEVEMTQ